MSNSTATTGIQPLVGELFGERYRVQGELGRGGMGAVYKALDTELRDTPVALKLINPLLAEDEVAFERFRSEVLIARALAHPNIARTYDLGRAPDGTYYITMELIEGESLAAKLKGCAGPLPIEEILRILREILLAAAYAHDKGVVHRDLKPANVLLTSTGEVKLVDFGTAHLMGADGLTRTGEMLGTPAYMAPEQICAGEIDHRTDLYSIALIAFELAEGRKPFKAPSVMGVLAQQSTKPLPKFERRDLPRGFKTAVRKAAEKSKDKRFRSAGEFFAALTPGSQTVEQSPVPTRRLSRLRLGGLAASLSILLLFFVARQNYSAAVQRPAPPETEAEASRQIEPSRRATKEPGQSKPARPAESGPEQAFARSTATPAAAPATSHSARTAVLEPVAPSVPHERSPLPVAYIYVRALDSHEPTNSLTVTQATNARIKVTFSTRLPPGTELHSVLRSASGDEVERLPLAMFADIDKPEYRASFNGRRLRPGRYQLELFAAGSKLESESLQIIADPVE